MSFSYIARALFVLIKLKICWPPPSTPPKNAPPWSLVSVTVTVHHKRMKNGEKKGEEVCVCVYGQGPMSIYTTEKWSNIIFYNLIRSSQHYGISSERRIQHCCVIVSNWNASLCVYEPTLHLCVHHQANADKAGWRRFIYVNSLVFTRFTCQEDQKKIAWFWHAGLMFYSLTRASGKSFFHGYL